jgi:hypothetical protein
MNTNLTTAQYLALVEQIGFSPRATTALKQQIKAGDAGAKFTVYGTALRKGLVKRGGAPLTEGGIVSCACGATYNGASRAMTAAHAGCSR